MFRWWADSGPTLYSGIVCLQRALCHRFREGNVLCFAFKLLRFCFSFLLFCFGFFVKNVSIQDKPSKMISEHSKDLDQSEFC